MTVEEIIARAIGDRLEARALIEGEHKRICERGGR